MQKSLISSAQLTKEFVFEVFTLADEIKENPEKYANSLSGKVITTLFFEPSTRTRLSFESALQRLGAKLLTVENGLLNSSANKGESIQDTIRIVQGYSDGIIMRHSENNASEIALEVAKVPIINAGDGSGEHPTQSLLDLYTIQTRKKSLNNLSIAFIGDLKFGRTVHSLVKSLSLFKNNRIYGVSSKEFELPNTYLDWLASNNITYIPLKTIDEIPKDIDVLYQTRVQTERFKEPVIPYEPLILNKNTFKRFNQKTILMHPLPRNEEIHTDVDNDPRAIYFEQSQNGLYVRMALLHLLLH